MNPLCIISAKRGAVFGIGFCDRHGRRPGAVDEASEETAMTGAKRFQLFAALAITICFCGALSAAEVRAKADVSCQPTGKPLQYDCTIRLTHASTDAPLTDVTVMVGADMPSMPMMHNVRPVKATVGRESGSYEVRLDLEMLGDWAVRLDLTGKARDRVVKVLRFEQDRVGPATASAKPPSPHKY
jgi:hypothetical protein